MSIAPSGPDVSVAFNGMNGTTSESLSKRSYVIYSEKYLSAYSCTVR